MADGRDDDGWTLVRRRRGRAVFRDHPATFQPVSQRVFCPSYPRPDPIRRTVASVIGARFHHGSPPRGRHFERRDRSPVDRSFHPHRHFDQSPDGVEYYGRGLRTGYRPPAPRGPPRAPWHQRHSGNDEALAFYRAPARDYSPRGQERRRRDPRTPAPVRTHNRIPPQTHDDRRRPPPSGGRRRRGPARTGADDEPHHRYGEERGRVKAPGIPRSSDPDFSTKNKVIYTIIKAVHHLDNIMGPTPPVTIARMAHSLNSVIKPAAPNPTTLALIRGNAENWAHTTTIILRDHYQDTIANQVRVFSLLTGPGWDQNFEIASVWARRHFGPRLLQASLDNAHDKLCSAMGNDGSSTDPLPDQRPTTRTPPRSPPRFPVPRTMQPTRDPTIATAQVHAPYDEGCLLTTPPSPPVQPSSSAVPPEPSSSAVPPEVHPVSPLFPLPLLSPLLFAPPPPLPVFSLPFSDPVTCPVPPKAQREARTPRVLLSPLPPRLAAERTVKVTASVDPSTGGFHAPVALSGSPPATPWGSVQSRLSFAPPVASAPTTPTRRPTRHVNTTNKGKGVSPGRSLGRPLKHLGLLNLSPSSQLTLRPRS